MSGRKWTPAEVEVLTAGIAEGLTEFQIAKLLPGRDSNSVHNKLKLFGGKRAMSKGLGDSPYPSYDEPLVFEGDALILPDPEFPFQHSGWINKCVDLARAWGIKHLVIAGDMVHMQSLAAFAPPWTDEAVSEWAGANFTLEMKTARKMIAQLVEEFSSVDLIMGNHEGRMLRAIGSVLTPETLLRLLSIEHKIRSAPYYFMTVVSNEVPFLIEHPRTTAKYAPGALSDKYQAHVLMAHSHKIGMTPSRSGTWQGWHIGCAVDESKLAYASQRHHAGDPHKLGAAIIRNGVVYPLFEGWVDWGFLKSLAP